MQPFVRACIISLQHFRLACNISLQPSIARFAHLIYKASKTDDT
nr:MAG TPA: hypothetical protein [Caudoviricetes sp.]